MLHSIFSRSAVLCAVLFYAAPGAAQLPDGGLPEFDIDMSQVEAISDRALAPFTFHVPVRLERVHPEVTEGRVTCVVFVGAGMEIVASGRTEIPIDRATGSYQGTIAVSAGLREEGRPPEEADFWYCQIAFRTTDRNWHIVRSGETIPVWARRLESGWARVEGRLEPATAPR